MARAKFLGVEPPPAPVQIIASKAGREWMTDAACRRVDPELFYPAGHGSRQIEAAARVCTSCPVLLQCRQYAIDIRDRWGVWGGLDVVGRHHWRRQQDRGI